MSQVQEIHFVHVHRTLPGAHLFVRLREPEVFECIRSPSYPESLVEEAVEWLGLFLDGVGGCSEYEWWGLHDGMPEHVEAVTGVPAHAMVQHVAEAWRVYDAKKVARTGSPQGDRVAL